MGVATIIFIIGALLIMFFILPNLATNLFQAKGQADYNLQKQKQSDADFQQQGLFGSIGTFFLGKGSGQQPASTASDKSNNTSSPNKNVGGILDAGEKGSSLYQVGKNSKQIYLRPDEVAYYQKQGVKVTAVNTNFIQDIQHSIAQVTN